jgi:vacuolar protein sorting-associated protein 13B
VQEEVELISDLPRVGPHSSVNYTPPHVNSKFPEFTSTGLALPKLHLAGAVCEGTVLWSHGIDPAQEHTAFVKIPEVYDVKISTVKLGHTIHVFIEPVSRAEVLAKEIRGRIKSSSKSEVIVKTADASTTQPIKPRSVEIVRSNVSPEARKSVSVDSCCQNSDSSFLQLSISCLCRQLDFVLLDETSSASVVREAFSASLENLTLSCHTTLDVFRSAFGQIQCIHRLLIGVGDMQLDNLLYGTGSYDFPVVLGRQTERRPDEDVGLSQWRVKRRIEHIVSHSLITCAFDVTCSHCTAVQTARFAIRPVSVYLEDVYASDMLKIIDSMVPTVPASSARTARSARRCPSKIADRAAVLSSPIRFERISIETIDMKVSVHASLKLYIASDNAPLSLGQFEQTNICTTSDELLRALAMHYASCALYRAGTPLVFAFD